MKLSIPGLISVIMPVYNSEIYLEEAINSILNQTHKNFEFIIINNGSTDNSLSIIKKFKEKDKRIILIERKNRSLIESLNDGLSKSKGQYIARMDSDDISLPSRLAKQFSFMENNKSIGVCGTWIEIIDSENKNKVKKFPQDDQSLKTTLLFSVPFPHPSVMIRASAIKEKFEYTLSYDSIEDYKLWWDMSKTTTYSTLPEILLKYRSLPNSVTNTAEKDFDQRMRSTQKVFNEVIKSLGIQNSNEEDKIHFIIGLNERVSKYKLNVNNVLNYFQKILIANKSSLIFNQKKLKNLLIKRILVFLYFKFKNFKFEFIMIILDFKFWKKFLSICMKH